MLPVLSGLEKQQVGPVEQQAQAGGRAGSQGPLPSCAVRTLWGPLGLTARLVHRGPGRGTYPVVQAILPVSWERVRFGIGES